MFSDIASQCSNPLRVFTVNPYASVRFACTVPILEYVQVCTHLISPVVFSMLLNFGIFLVHSMGNISLDDHGLMPIDRLVEITYIIPIYILIQNRNLMYEFITQLINKSMQTSYTVICIDSR